jgi:energy-converting hydrogenase Eha subunit A
MENVSIYDFGALVIAGATIGFLAGISCAFIFIYMIGECFTKTDDKE